MRLPVPVADAREESGRAEAPDRWLAPAYLALVGALAVGLIMLGAYQGRPDHHPEFYGDYRGGYVKGLELRAAGLAKNSCETSRTGPYTWRNNLSEIQAKGIYLVGCTRGAKGKPMGDYVRRVDFVINND